MNFAHLQISTAYSLLSSTISINKLVEKAKEQQYSALAITDHNALYGVFSFYQSCIKANIKPIIGLTADIETSEEVSHPLILLAKNNHGYKNLLKISSAIKTKNTETISMKWLKAYSEGLIAITPGYAGEIEQFIQEGKREEAEACAKLYLSIFGEDNFYISLQRKLPRVNDEFTDELNSFAQSMHIPVVATNDVQYVEKEDAFAHICITAIRDGEKLTSIEEPEQNEQYVKSQEEMSSLFSDIPEALENTLVIVENCNVMIETSQQLLPKYPLKQGEEAADVLYELCQLGLQNRMGIKEEPYLNRLEFELNIINQMGFNDYFLIVWDFMKYAKDHDILTGPGRGSAAGSLVAYVLGITDVDPIKHGLLFERFLNPERISMPDIDIDFPDHRRDEVIEYVMEKYGRLHVAQIITFGTFAAKASIRDTSRVFGLSTKEMDQLARLIPSKLGLTLHQAYKESAQLRTFVQASEKNQKLFDTALKLEGLPRHTSTHAAGVVISERPLIQYVPVQGEETGIYLTQFPMETLEEIGLLKMDFLGLRNLSLLERVAKTIKIATGNKIEVKEIPHVDEETIKLLQKGDTTGIFQLESDGMRKVLKELRPTEFEDIVAVNALYRPGPMEYIPDYIARKHGDKTVLYPHPDLKPILGYTYGVVVYQEQIMQIASKMAGYSLGEADLLRRAVSKKKRDILDEERSHFIQGALQLGYEEKTANETYDLIVRFANYGFNRSHAVAYSFIAWQLAYLKAHYPQHFMAALLTSVIGNDDKIASYIAETKQKGIDILPPSINISQYPFIAEKGAIRYSLSAIKGIGANAMRAIMHARKSRPFSDIFDLSLRLPQQAVNRKAYEALIYAGALDEFGHDRAVLLATIDVAIEHAQLMRPNDGELDLLKDDPMFNIQPRYIEVESIGMADKLFYEKQVLGLYLSDHPTESYKVAFEVSGVTPIYEIQSKQRNISVGAYVTNVKQIRTKKGDAMAFLKISDSSGDMEGVVFPEAYRRFMAICKEGEILLISGNVDSRGDHFQLIVDKMIKAADIKIDERKLYLKVPAELHNKETLQLLQTALQENQGDTPIILHYEKTKKTYQLGRKDWVNPSENFLVELKSLLGDHCVILK